MDKLIVKPLPPPRKKISEAEMFRKILKSICNFICPSCGSELLVSDKHGYYCPKCGWCSW